MATVFRQPTFEQEMDRELADMGLPPLKEQEAINAAEAFAASTALLTPTPDPPTVDATKAFDELEGWILRGAGGRACWCIDRIGGKWKVGLSAQLRESEPGSVERLTAGEDRELRGAIRNALMIAKFAGYL